MVNTSFTTSGSSISSSSSSGSGATIIEASPTNSDIVICNGHVFYRTLGMNTYIDFILACQYGIADKIWKAVPLTEYSSDVYYIANKSDLNKYTVIPRMQTNFDPVDQSNYFDIVCVKVESNLIAFVGILFKKNSSLWDITNIVGLTTRYLSTSDLGFISKSQSSNYYDIKISHALTDEAYSPFITQYVVYQAPYPGSRICIGMGSQNKSSSNITTSTMIVIKDT